MVVGFGKLKYMCYLKKISFNIVVRDEITFQRTEKLKIESEDCSFVKFR